MLTPQYRKQLIREKDGIDSELARRRRTKTRDSDLKLRRAEIHRTLELHNTDWERFKNAMKGAFPSVPVPPIPMPNESGNQGE